MASIPNMLSGNFSHQFWEYSTPHFLWSQWNATIPNKKKKKHGFWGCFFQNWTGGNRFLKNHRCHVIFCLGFQPPSTYWCCPWTVSHHQKAFSPWWMRWMPNLSTGRWVPHSTSSKDGTHFILPWLPWLMGQSSGVNLLHLRNSKRYMFIHVQSSYIFKKEKTCPARDIVQVEEWIIHPTVASSHGALQHDTLLAFPNLNSWHPIDGTARVILGRGIHDVIGSHHDA